MVCDKCEFIADEVQCQGCADDILNDCSNGNCCADSVGSEVNGHSIDWNKFS